MKSIAKNVGQPIDELVEQLNALMAELRQKTDEPVLIQYASELSIEVRPAAEDDRVSIKSKDRGVTVVDYQPDGLEVQVFAEDEIGTLNSDWFDNSDLVVEPDEEQEVFVFSGGRQ